MSQDATRVNTDPRFSRRRRAVERSKRRRLLAGAGAVAVVAGVAWALFWSPLLDVRSVELVGAEVTTTAEVEEVTGLLRDRPNLLLLPSERVRDDVSSLPWVESVKVDRMLPGTVRIRVVEREAAIVLSLGSARWMVDAHGYVLAAGADAGLPVLAGVEVGEVAPGVRLRTAEARAALKVFADLPRSLEGRVEGIFAPTVERVSFSLDTGTVVRYGAAEQTHDKNEVLKVLLARLAGEGRRPAYIDVRVPASPAVARQEVADGGAIPSPTPSPTPTGG